MAYPYPFIYSAPTPITPQPQPYEVIDFTKYASPTPVSPQVRLSSGELGHRPTTLIDPLQLSPQLQPQRPITPTPITQPQRPITLAPYYSNNHIDPNYYDYNLNRTVPVDTTLLPNEHVVTEGEFVNSPNKTDVAPVVPVAPIQADYNPATALQVTPSNGLARSPWVSRPMTNCENGQCVDGMPYTSGLSRSTIADANRFGQYGIQTVGDQLAYNHFMAPLAVQNEQLAKAGDLEQIRLISNKPEYASLVENITKANGGNRAEAQVLAMGQLGGEGLVYRMMSTPFSQAQEQGASRANTQAAHLNQDAGFQATGRPRVLQNAPDATTTSVQMNDNTYMLPSLSGGNTPTNLITMAQGLGQTQEATIANIQAAQKAQAQAYKDSVSKAVSMGNLAAREKESAARLAPKPVTERDRLALQQEILRLEKLKLERDEARKKAAGNQMGNRPAISIDE